MFKFNYSKYTPRELSFGGGGLHGRRFPFQKLFLNAPGLIHGGGYYRNFTLYQINIIIFQIWTNYSVINIIVLICKPSSFV